MVLPWAPLQEPFVQLGLSLPVYAVGLWFFGRSAWSSLKGGFPNMDVLIFIGASAALFYSLFGTYYFFGTHEVHQYLFYETGATIITLVLFGNVLEKRSVKKTTHALTSLTSLQPQTAKLIATHEGHEHVKEVVVTQLCVGDILLVNSGDLIPMDGEIVSGVGECDESLITGESLPILKEPKSIVTGGTYLLSGTIQMRVTKLLRESVLSQIIEMVKKAQGNKPSIQKLGDRVSAIFVPAVVLIALFTFVFSYFWLEIGSARSMLRAVAVLVISCPCAMGLATPTAIMVGIGKAAKRGIIIKGGDVLENFARTKTVIFDKTGTLSTGRFVFSNFEFPKGDEEGLKNLIWHLEQRSSHPIAKMLVSTYPQWKLESPNFSSVIEHKGMGMEGVDQSGANWKIGSARFTGTIGNADLYLTCNNQIYASWNLEDEIKSGSETVIRYFENQGVEAVLLSGDRSKKVKALSDQLGIRDYHSEQLPADKLSYIVKRQGTEPVTMVGDGVNDAPALSKVSVGISFAKGSDIAIQSANLVLMRPEIGALSEAHKISKMTYRTIQQNLFWAFFYNVLCIPLAAAGFMHPMLGALSMAFSDVIVIGNSLRLGIRKIR